MAWLESLFANPFLKMALLAGIAASVTSGIVGSYIVVKRIVFIAGSIAHSVLGGMGICLWLARRYDIGVSPLQGALIAALVSALLIGWVHLKYQEREDTVIAAIWSTGMSIGVIFIALTPGYNVELMNYLFGNILWVSRSDIHMLLGLDILVAIVAYFFHIRFSAICFDEQQAYIQKVPIKSYYMLLLALVALSVVILIQIVGAILVIAMLAIPAAIASSLTHRFYIMMLLAIVLGCLFTILGTFASYQFNWPPGATIALTSAVFYLLGFPLRIKRLN